VCTQTPLTRPPPPPGPARPTAAGCCARGLPCCPDRPRAGGVGSAVAATQRGDLTLLAFGDPVSLQAPPPHPFVHG
jgi:hypothetical protein